MEGLSGFDKMWASFIAMGLMVLASLLITYARSKTKGLLRAAVSFVAFIMLLVSVIYMLVSIF